MKRNEHYFPLETGLINRKGISTLENGMKGFNKVERKTDGRFTANGGALNKIRLDKITTTAVVVTTAAAAVRPMYFHLASGLYSRPAE